VVNPWTQVLMWVSKSVWCPKVFGVQKCLNLALPWALAFNEVKL